LSFLLDTSVLVDFLRGHAAAIQFVTTIVGPPMLPVVVVTELYAGVREGKERRQLEEMLHLAEILDVTSAVAVEAGLMLRRYGRSHGLELADALIAATAQVHGLQLITLNRKHFPMLADLLVPY
jgi:predicted nucleic acid-binding protein